MRKTVTGVGLLALALIGLRLQAPLDSSAATVRDFRPSATNPCEGLPDGNIVDVEYTARWWVADTAEDAAGAAFREDSLGLSTWPADSVVATTDSTVCAHVDSLINVWLASPAAGGITRVSWWTSNAVARVNPGKYWVRPAMSVDGLRYNFVVDSVGGGVRFFRSAVL